MSPLGNWKTLKLNCNKYSVSNLLRKLVGLTYLELANGPFDDNTFENFMKLTSLTVLKFNEMTEVSNSHIFTIGKELKLLKKFHIKTNEFISRIIHHKRIRSRSSLFDIFENRHTIVYIGLNFVRDYPGSY